MKTTDLSDLLKTVEVARSKLHPELDSSFLKMVVEAEQRSPEDDEEALREIQSALSVIVEAPESP